MDGTKLNRRQLRITKRRLREIVKEEKAKLVAEQMEMDPKTANTIQTLQTIHANLNDYVNNIGMGVTRRELENVIDNQLALLEDAIHALGGVI